MPATGSNDVSVVDLANSSTTPLGGAAVFTGAFVNVTGYTAISTLLATDQIVAEAKWEWSADGVTAIDESIFFEDFSPLSFGGGIGASSRVRAPFVRVVVTNDITPQGTFTLQTKLCKGTPVGFISPLVLFPSDGDDGQTTKSVLYGRRPSGSPTYTQVLVDGNGRLSVVRPPNPVSNVRLAVTASLTAVDLDTGIFGPNRKRFTVFNDTDSGTLYIRLGGPPALNDFDFKIPPQHTWKLDDDWYIWGGSIEGIWDVADGTAYTSEII